LGIDYMIMDQGFAGTNDNGPVSAVHFAQDSITFTLNFNGNLSESDISNVRFQWGTTLNEANEPGVRLNTVPEPLSLIAMGMGGVLALSLVFWRRKPA
jgi:hypothetical protein